MRKKWIIIPALLLVAAGMVMVGCSSPSNGSPTDSSSSDIDWTAVADDLEPSTKIIITFGSDVTGLTAENITVTNGTGATGGQVTKGQLTGSGKIWDLGITVAKAGNVSVRITKSGIVAGPKTVAVKEAGTDPNAMAGYSKTKEITFGAQYDFGDDDDPAWDIINLSDLDDIEPGSKLRLHFTATASKANTGIGSIGYLTEDKTKVNNKFDLDVPANQTLTTGFFIDIWAFYAKSTLALDYEDTLSIISWKSQGATLSKIELWEPNPGEDISDPPLPVAPAKPASVAMTHFEKVQEVAVECGVFNIGLGKGNITGVNFTAIKDASENAMLRIYINNNSGSDRNSWGIGTIGGVEIKGKAGTSFYWDVKASDVQDNLTNASTFISTNVWGGCAITMIELWEPEEGFEPYQYTIANGTLYLYFTEPVLKKDYKYTATLTVTRMDEGLVGNGLNGQCEGANPYLAIGSWGDFAHNGSRTIVAVPDGGSVVYVYKFTASNDIGASTQQGIKLIVQNAQNATITGDYGIDCSVVVTEEEPPPPPPPPTDVLDILSSTDGKADFVTLTTGTYNNTGKTITPTAADVTQGDQTYAEFHIVMSFSAPIDLSEYTHLAVSYGGVAEIKQVGSFMPGFNDSPKVMAQVSSITSDVYNLTYELGTNLKTWGGSDQWADAVNCSQLEIVINAIDVGSNWHKLLTADAGDFVITSIQFYKQAELTKVRELNTDTDWDYRENNTNKGKIAASTAAAIKALPAGSVLRVYISGKVYDPASDGKPGANWGIGSIGGVNFNVPSNATGSADGTDYTGSVDIPTSGIELASDEYSIDIINVNIYSGFVIDKIEIWSM